MQGKVKKGSDSKWFLIEIYLNVVMHYFRKKSPTRKIFFAVTTKSTAEILKN